MSADMDKVLNRVKKLLALAADSAASEGERDNALRMAHNTLAKHNLSMAQVEATGDLSNNDPRLNAEFDLMADKDWTRHVANGIGKLFFCQYFTMNGVKPRHCFVGKSVNVTTATLMTEYVINSIRKESDKAAKHHFGDCTLNNLFGGDGPTRPDASKPVWAEAFCAAAGTVVRQRCIEMANAANAQRAEGSTGTSLVLGDYYKQELEANNRFIKEVMGLNLGIGHGRQARDVGSARSSGAAFGKGINLSQQVGASSQRLRLK